MTKEKSNDATQRLFHRTRLYVADLEDRWKEFTVVGWKTEYTDREIMNGELGRYEFRTIVRLQKNDFQFHVELSGKP